MSHDMFARMMGYSCGQTIVGDANIFLMNAASPRFLLSTTRVAFYATISLLGRVVVSEYIGV